MSWWNLWSKPTRRIPDKPQVTEVSMTSAALGAIDEVVAAFEDVLESVVCEKAIRNKTYLVKAQDVSDSFGLAVQKFYAEHCIGNQQEGDSDVGVHTEE